MNKREREKDDKGGKEGRKMREVKRKGNKR